MPQQDDTLAADPAAFPAPERFDPPALEERILERWDAENIFEKSLTEREDAPAFTFYEGPPTANGRPGIHHVMSRAIKDLFCRYKTMQGYRVERKAGWDTHGLPVEIEVEKELGLEDRQDVLDYGIDRYNAACRESVLEYRALWDDLTRRMGYWVDLDDPYVTYESEYIESVWWLLKQIRKQGLLYKGYKIQWYSPGSGTVLSSHEVSLGYEETQDPSVYVRFPVAGEEDTYFLAWTTTPWTLISNTALAVGPDVEYVKLRLASAGERGRGSVGESLILAQSCVDEVLQGEEHDIVERFPGRELAGRRYEPPFDYFTDRDGAADCWRVLEGDFVTTEEGTGVVHMAPAFGADDYQIGVEREGLPLFCPVDEEGRFTEEAPLVEGQWFKDADKPINDDLKERGLMYLHETYLHNYPHDWRKGTPLMSYPVESWFIETTAVKDRLVELNKTINWQPEGIGTGRFGEWLEGNVDWALSRRRYWGTPLPVWQSDENPEYIEVVGSIAELREKCARGDGNALPEDDREIDLHRPFVDELTWPAPAEDEDGHAVGGTMRRVPDLIDVWFDSGAMPFAQWHYPFENEEKFENNFPADFIAEGVDQTRGWFYTLQSEGNAPEPRAVIEEHGADVVRWYMMSNTPPWENIKFSERGLRDTRRGFFGTLQNVYKFFATYANVDGFRFAEGRMPVDERPELDRWILSRLHSTVQVARTAMDEYDPTTAARSVEAFVDDLSNWHVRRSRDRFWAAKQSESSNAGEGATEHLQPKKRAAYQTVYECLLATAKLMAPIAPFFGEWLYRALAGTSGHGAEAASVHLASFPEADGSEIDAELEHRMGLARQIASVGRSLRSRAGLNVRQPLRRILVAEGAGVERRAVEAVREAITDEVNVKDIDYVTAESDVVERSAVPNFERLGPRLGSLMQPTNEAVRALSDDDIARYREQGSLTLQVDGETVELGPGDLEIRSEGIEGWQVGTEGGVTVALDTEVTPELRAEGLAREAVSRVQNLRRVAALDVTDRVEVGYEGTDAATTALASHAAYVRNETLALRLQDTLESDARAAAEEAAQQAGEDGERPEQSVGEHAAAGAYDLGGGERLTLHVRRAERPEATAPE
ncbi:MAG: isoleucine--tRNA ligase [Bacteroidetes bacterium QS_9_68_14]|nr:MAG: isoleucine--tRNA ligase [Bacteroidetes bacterium QS_9_68_14]